METSVEKLTLHKFVDDNYKLIAGMAAFIGLTAFASQLSDNEAKLSIGGCAFLAAGIFALELFRRLPFQNQHWRLALFEFTMLILVLDIGRYFVVQFRSVWGPYVSLLLNMMSFLGPPILLGSLADWVLKARTHMSERSRHRVASYIFSGSAVSLFVLIFVLLSGRNITVRIPQAVTKIVQFVRQ